jgi:hypothetical protein
MRERTHIGHVIHNTRRWSAANAACTHYDKEAKPIVGACTAGGSSTQVAMHGAPRAREAGSTAAYAYLDPRLAALAILFITAGLGMGCGLEAGHKLVQGA